MTDQFDIIRKMIKRVRDRENGLAVKVNDMRRDMAALEARFDECMRIRIQLETDLECIEHRQAPVMGEREEAA